MRRTEQKTEVKNMAFPKHPETILVKNDFYPDGLKEIDTWNYYQSVKDKLIPEVSGKDLMIFISIDTNKTTVLRKGKLTNFIRLNRSNWDDTFHSRMLSIHSTFHNTEEIGVIDIDGNDFKKNKQATIDVYEYVTSKFSFIDSAFIKFTGKNSFHIVCNLKRLTYIDSIKIMLSNSLKMSELNRKYFIDDIRRIDKTIPNLDLSSLKWRGAYIALHSLSVLGLRCMKVSLEKIHSFKKEDAIIKTI
jgi:hypothetical protein